MNFLTTTGLLARTSLDDVAQTALSAVSPTASRRTPSAKTDIPLVKCARLRRGSRSGAATARGLATRETAGWAACATRKGRQIFTSAQRSGLILLAFLASGAPLAAKAGTVQTRDGALLHGRILLEPPDALVVTPSNAPSVRVALSNLFRADFTNPTNRPPPLSPRLAPLAMDDVRGALPEPWRNLDLGTRQAPGSAVHYRGRFTLESAQPARGTSEEGVHFVCQPFRGDGEIIARVASITPRDQKDKQAKAGVVIRASLETDASTLIMAVSGGGGAYFRRGRIRTVSTDDRRPDLKPPYWVKLRREGNAISAFHSTDGRRWVALEKTDYKLPERCYVGLAAMSRRPGSPATAEFDHVVARPLESRANFTPRIVLLDGTIVADHFRGVDDTVVSLSPEMKDLRVLTRHVARLQFRPMDATEELQTGRSGVLLSNGDFVDGEFQCVTNGRVLIGSVLFGRRSLDIGKKVAAVVLRDPSAAVPPAAFEARTFDGSIWRVRRTEVEADGLTVDTALLGRWRIPSADLQELVCTSELKVER